MITRDFSTLIESDIYSYCGFWKVKYGVDDDYNRDKSVMIPPIKLVCTHREQTKACANLQTKNIR